jgi:PleD family two-component response regulator
VTLSIGVSTTNEEVRGADIDAKSRDLVARADRALYAAKNGGRNRVVSEALVERLTRAPVSVRARPLRLAA